MRRSQIRHKNFVYSVIGLVLALLTIGAIVRQKEPVFTVQTQLVTRRDLIEKVVANGRIQPTLQVKISPEVSGEIIELPIKEGQQVKKGDLLVKIKPDFYIAQVHQCEAAYLGAAAGKAQADANLEKASADFNRNQDLFHQRLISEADFVGFKAAYEVAKAQVESALHQVENTRAAVASAQDSLDLTTIVAPLSGTISKLNSRLGERVLGTVQNVGTEIMTIANLNEMEARVDVGEDDVELIKPGQKAELEVDAFKDQKFSGTVTEVADSANDVSGQSSTTSQEATKFQIRIRVLEKEPFRPGMSVTAEIQTRYRTNVLTVPIASVTARIPKAHHNKTRYSGLEPAGTHVTRTGDSIDRPATATKTPVKPVEVVFVVNGNRVKMVPVKVGISDDDYFEITDGLCEGQEIVSGGYRAISRDLEDDARIQKGATPTELKSRIATPETG